jgi:hypothetical protein
VDERAAATADDARRGALLRRRQLPGLGPGRRADRRPPRRDEALDGPRQPRGDRAPSCSRRFCRTSRWQPTAGWLEIDREGSAWVPPVEQSDASARSTRSARRLGRRRSARPAPTPGCDVWLRADLRLGVRPSQSSPQRDHPCVTMQGGYYVRSPGATPLHAASPSSKRPAVPAFGRALRLRAGARAADNPALRAAVDSGRPLVACFVMGDAGHMHGRPEYWSEMIDMGLDPVPR